MALIEIKVPDIGDFEEVAVIEVLVKPGDTIKAEQSLVTVESDKASMEIPSSAAGVVKELKVALGDKVAKGSVMLTLEAAGAGAGEAAGAASGAGAQVRSGAGAQAPSGAGAQAPSRADAQAPSQPTAVPAGRVSSPAQTAAKPAASTAAVPSPQPTPSYAGGADVECDMLVLGAGPGGYSAAFRAADLGMKTVLVERYATLGGVCLNVGCIPSKALLHVAAVMDEVDHFGELGISFAKPQIDLTKLRAHKDKVVGKLTGGLAAMAKMRKVTVVTGSGEFADPHT
jgi:dihydrolipoamide dehydrogenase